jgi:probable O-glycosylation ligase (exosortase A-associated)
VRDIALTSMVAVLLLMVFKHPVIGAYVWAWLSLMNPHKMTYGFAFRLPFAHAAAVVTLLALLGTHKRQPLPMSALVVLQMLFLSCMVFTSFFAMADPDEVIARVIVALKIHLMLWVTWMLVTDARQLRWLVWVVTLSVSFFGIKGGWWTIVTGGGGRVWGPPGGMLEGNNELAVALVMLMPMLYFLRQTEPNIWLRRFLLFAMVTCSFSILGSQSRGALLALLAMAFFLGLKGKYPVRTSLLLLVFVAVAIGFMPDSWSNRMDSMRSYQADGSAMSRIWTWTTLWNAAVDRPFLGAGFAADNLAVFAKYAPQGSEYAVFAGRVFVAHSIYFQVLGEHGFVAFTLFMLLGVTTWLSASRIASQTKDHAELGSWMPLLMRMVQVSLIGYAVGGAFLSLAYLDLPYYVMGFVVSSGALVQQANKKRPVSASAIPMPLPARPPPQRLTSN